MSSEPSVSSAASSSPTGPGVGPGTILAGKYRVDRVLGAGGMGLVVAAKNVELGKPVAIKMMLPAALGMPRAVERFEREARAVVLLRSEHVAEVLDIGKLEDGAPYIVMELLEGTDFEGLLRGDRRFEVVDAVDFVLQACEAIAEAHALDIVHRDLKPRNLFLTHRLDGSPLVKVLDFGISKWTPADTDSHALTRTSDVMGSPNYMSPEQVRSSRDVDGRTDIWSLGVILFELLAGRVPFLADSLPQLCAMVLEQNPPVLSALRPDIPPELVAIIARCLEKDPARRFQSIAELAAALAAFAPRETRRTSNYSRPPGTSVPRMAAHSSSAPAPASAEAIAKTEHMSAPPHGVSPHAFTSSSPVHGGGSRTSASWEGSELRGKPRAAWVVPLVLVGSMLVIGLVVALLVGLRSHVIASPWVPPPSSEPTVPTASASAATSASASATPPPAASASASAGPTATAASASASAGPTATATALATGHVRPPVAGPDAARPQPPPTPPPTRSAATADPLTPFDRK